MKLILQWLKQSSDFYIINRMAMGLLQKKMMSSLKANAYSMDLCREDHFHTEINGNFLPSNTKVVNLQIMNCKLQIMT